MRTSNGSLRKLILAARKAHVPLAAPFDTPVPFGFSTRVAARWVAVRGPSNQANLWERLCWWGASVSVAVCLTAFVSQSFQPEGNPFDPLMEPLVDGPEMF